MIEEIESFIISFLGAKLDVPVYGEKPDRNKPERFIVVDKTGGGKSNHLPDATIAFQSYAESKHEASQLNERLKKAVEKMINLDEIRGLTLNSDYNFTDTTTKEYRYQAVYDIRYY